MATLLSLLTLSAILMATSALARTTSSALPGIQNMLHEKLKASLDSAATEMSIGGTRYVSGGRLGSIRKVILGDPNDVALRLYSESAPGYLRGHAFDLYKDRQWHSAPGIVLGNHSAVKATENRYVNRTGTGTTPLAKKLRTKLSRFPIHEDQQQATISIEVHNDPIKGPTVFTPLGTRWLEASSGQLTITHNDIVQSGVAVTRPYIAGVASNPPQQSLTTERGKIFLWVPEEISPLAEKLTAEICRNETTASGKAGAISRYFQETFQYSLSGLPIPKRAEPIVFFLETEHPAHCEYFASATVMLLRSSGVPARYVTGYVATEASDDAEYWIARNRDAHAWAEAYDNESQRWFPVESTPGRTYQTLDFKDANQNGSTLFGGKGDRDDFGDRSRLGQIWGWLMSMRATDPLIVIFRIAQLPLFCLLAFLLWRRSGRSSSGHSQPIDVQSRRMLRQVDRRMRSYALVRVPHETLHQFAARIENRLMAENASDKSQVLIAAATWYRQYADARYRGRLPNPFQRVSSHRVTVSKR